jgi:hypothetical protein
MSQHDIIEGAPSSSEPASATPKMALAGGDTGGKVGATPKSETATSAPKLEAATVKTGTTTAPRKLLEIHTPHAAADSDEPPRGKHAADADRAAAEPAERSPNVSRFTLLAAALALAAALGAMVGALAAYGLARPGATVAGMGRMGVEDVQALKENIVQARVELAALKLSIESANRNAMTQFTRIGERIDRAQAEPAAKLNKAIDALERVSRSEVAAGKDVTGSIAPPAGGANQAGKGSAVEGWVVRDVRRGTALIEGRMGLVEVEQGDVVPGLGRVDAIRRQDGRWVVVTARGLIMPPR